MLDLDRPPALDTDRFELRRLLGRGGFGVVWEALDRSQGVVVALKTLHALDARDALLRFKNEFRALTDVVHPNLVALYELVTDGDTWFFTMERIEGRPLLDHVRTSWDGGSEETWDLSLEPPDHDEPEREPERAALDGTPELDEPALRQVLPQLVDAVCAMHEAGVVHQDLKPANVLVTDAGRLVVLDFGLAAERAARGDGSRAGTPAYMSPEQVDGGPVGPASDWYSVGVMLFEALTGRLPFDGAPTQILQSKRHYDAPDPGEIRAGLPDDLRELARRLLLRDPADRPDGAAVRAAVGLPPLRTRRPPFVGREGERRALHEALDASRAGCRVVQLQGPSGIGKSALAQRFLAELATGGVRVLTGRCYERETVPYKALDDLVDGLVPLLAADPGPHLEDLRALARLFPVLRRPFDLGEPEASDEDVHELRRRASRALRRVFGRLAEDGPLLLLLDDVQWGDADSAALLEDLVRPPGAPRVLLVATCRAEGADAGEGADAVVPAALRSAPDHRVLQLSELPPDDARALAEALVGSARADALLEEAGGHPYFLDGLARQVDAPGSAPSLQGALEARLDALPDPTRRLLALLALAGRPTERRVLRAAAELPADQLPVSQLHVARLVRSQGTGVAERLEPWHDRVRDAVVARIPDAAPLHRRLADALEGHGATDLEAIAWHRRGAGQRDEARALLLRAAARAETALAFHHAARLYEEAVALGADGWETQRALARARAGCGRGIEAATAYLAAADTAPEGATIELRRRAAEQLLASGHVDRGLEVIARVLRAVGLRPTRTPRGALLSLLAGRARLWWRGLGFTRRDQVPDHQLLEIDTCWSIASAMGTTDTIRATDFQVRHLLAALEAGEPYRVSRALALEAVYHCAGGVGGEPRAREILGQAQALAEELDHPHARAMVALADGATSYLVGRWSRAVEQLVAADVLLRTRCRDATWERTSVVTFYLDALTMLGRWDRLRDEIPAYLAEARQQGNLQFESYLTYVRATCVRLAEDRAEQGIEEVRRGLVHESRRGYHVSRWWSTFAMVQNELYLGRVDEAAARFAADWPRMRSSLMLRVELLGATARFQRARVLVAQAARRAPGLRRRWLLWQAGREASWLASREASWPSALAHLIRAGIASVDADRAPDALAGARAELEAADALFEACDMGLYRSVTRYRLGQLGGGDSAALLAGASGWLSDRGIARPDRIADLFAPGRWPT